MEYSWCSISACSLVINIRANLLFILTLWRRHSITMPRFWLKKLIFKELKWFSDSSKAIVSNQTTYGLTGKHPSELSLYVVVQTLGLAGFGVRKLTWNLGSVMTCCVPWAGYSEPCCTKNHRSYITGISRDLNEIMLVSSSGTCAHPGPLKQSFIFLLLVTMAVVNSSDFLQKPKHLRVILDSAFLTSLNTHAHLF